MRWKLGVLALLLSLGATADADPVRCTCAESGGCYHWLGAPVAAPEDPCVCPLCRAQPGACPKNYPKSWDPVCAGNGKLECFLRRHGDSWHIACSERLAGTCACRSPHPEWCPRCGKNGEDWLRDELGVIERQLPIERRVFGPRAKLVMVKGPHFYLVTDVKKLKVRTQERNFRVLGTHEIAHLFLQRAEIAYRDFTARFGDAVTFTRPAGIYLTDSESTKQAIASAYIGLPDPELCYGGDFDSIAGGFGWNCSVFSREKYRTDRDLHHQMRHLVAHQIISCWKRVGGSNDILPRWVYAGAGHWLARLPEALSDTANFCSGEGVSVKDNGEGWDKKVRAFAASDRSLPIEQVFLAESLGALDLEMHIRAWSIFDVWLREDPERFVRFLARVREGIDQRKALREVFQCSPEEFDRRWRDRVLGKRDSVRPTAAELDRADPERPGAGERASILAETDPDRLAAKIRALSAVDDPLTAEVLVPLLASEDENVRETTVYVLSRARKPEVLAWLRDHGLPGAGGLALANLARAIGVAHDERAGPALLEAARSSFWLARAHAATALGLIGYEPAIPTIAGLADDRVGPVRVAAMDALGRFGAKAAAHADGIADHLGDSAWQLRSAAAECLGALGRTASVDALIDRMEVESGRVREDIRNALKRITRDDLGMDPKHWREFWEREKARGGGAPKRPEPAPKPEDEGYAPGPTYYGLNVFSRSVGYAVDTSTSMAYRIHVDESWIRRSGRDYPVEGTKYELTRREISASLSSLDPRVRFGLWFFRTTASAYRDDLLPASPGNVESALARVASEAPRADTGDRNRRTNYIDVLRMVYGCEAGKPPRPAFQDTPDTLFFLTDGKPTVGDVRDPDVLLSWLAERNRFARIRLHVITFGSRESRIDFLKAMADENGGRFVMVPEAR